MWTLVSAGQRLRVSHFVTVCCVPLFWVQQPRPGAPAPGSRNASALASAAALLYDIGDDAAGDSPDSSAAATATSAHPWPRAASTPPPPAASPSSASSGGTHVHQAAAPAGAVRVLPPPPGLQVPQYTLRELQPPLPSPQADAPSPHTGSCSQQDKQQQQLEVVVVLPGVGDPGEVDVWLAPEGPGLGAAGGGGEGGGGACGGASGSLLRVTVAGRYHLEVRGSELRCWGQGAGQLPFGAKRASVILAIQGVGRPYSC